MPNSKLHCPKCGAEASEGDAYCVECGTKQERSATPQQQAVRPAAGIDQSAGDLSSADGQDSRASWKDAAKYLLLLAFALLVWPIGLAWGLYYSFRAPDKSRRTIGKLAVGISVVMAVVFFAIPTPESDEPVGQQAEKRAADEASSPREAPATQPEAPPATAAPAPPDNGLPSYEVFEVVEPPIGKQVQVVVAPDLTEEDLRRLDNSLAEKYDVREAGEGQCIWYMDSRDAAAKREDLDDPSWAEHCVAMHTRSTGFTYFPPEERLSRSRESEEAQVSSEAASEASSAQDLPALTAVELYNKFDENQIAAERKYGGQRLLITGTIDDIGRDILDTTYVTLKTGDPMWSVQCMFASDKEDAVAAVSKGDKVTIEGEVADLETFNVIVRYSQLVDK